MALDKILKPHFMGKKQEDVVQEELGASVVKRYHRDCGFQLDLFLELVVHLLRHSHPVKKQLQTTST